MRSVFQAVVVSLFFGLAPVLAQLPPEIVLDSNLLRAEQSAREGDHVGARAAMARISELQEEHDLVPSAEYHYRYARVWDAVEDWNRALASVVRYLELEGREGQYYRDALALMNNATGSIERIERDRELRAAELARARAAAVRAREEMERALNAARELIPQLEFVSVPAGTFRMGSSDRRRAGTLYYPRTRVRISRPYEIGRYEITQEEWQAVMGSNPSKFAGCGRCPVENVSWEDVQRFITILNSVDGSTWTYRLPTEAEWEYAARAGERAERFAPDSIEEFAWIRDNSGDRTHPVGQKRPNRFGLYDVHGNVTERVQDWYADYPGGTVVDPTGPASGDRKVSRGCTYRTSRGYCERGDRSSQYLRSTQYLRSFPVHDYIGFRLARTARSDRD